MKILYGPTIGSASGSVAGSTYSRNRYGAYVRNRAKPVISTTEAAINQKAVFSSVSRFWKGLTDDERQAWKEWAGGNPIIDRLGSSQILAPNVAFMRCNTVLTSFGADIITAPPAYPGPSSMIPTSITADSSPQTLSMVLPDSALDANTGLQIYIAVPGSAGINYVEQMLKRTENVQPLATSPVNLLAGYTAMFGALVTGSKVVVDVHAIDIRTGLKAPRSRTIVTVA